MEIDLSSYDSCQAAYDGFEWEIPEEFNIAEAVCGRWAAGDDGKCRVALFYEGEDGNRETYTFWQVQRLVDRVSNLLTDVGVERGTRVGIVFPQQPETLFATLGVLQAGGVSVPLSVLYGTEGLRYRLDHSRTEVAVVGPDRADTLAELRDDLDHLETVVTVNDPAGIEGRSWGDGIAAAAPEFETVRTAAEDPAYII
jgi:acetyl-CoA synthetase